MTTYILVIVAFLAGGAAGWFAQGAWGAKVRTAEQKAAEVVDEVKKL